MALFLQDPKIDSRPAGADCPHVTAERVFVPLLRLSSRLIACDVRPEFVTVLCLITSITWGLSQVSLTACNSARFSGSRGLGICSWRTASGV